MVLNQLLLIPILGAILIAVTPVKEMSEKEAYDKLVTELDSKPSNKEDEQKRIELIIKNENLERTGTIKKIALTTSIINFLVSLYL